VQAWPRQIARRAPGSPQRAAPNATACLGRGRCTARDQAGTRRNAHDRAQIRRAVHIKIVDVIARRIHYRSGIVRDSEGHSHPGPEHDATQFLVTIVTDEGLTGDAFGRSPEVIMGLIRPLLLRQDPFYCERLWQMLRERQRLHLGQLADSVLCVIDLCLWDLAGKYANLSVNKLLGATHDKVPA
jgi:hypothetical protein